MAARLASAIAQKYGDIDVLEATKSREEKKFQICSDQIILLNNKVEALETRLIRAEEAGRNSHIYMLQLQLSTLEGVRDVMHKYCSQLADSLNYMHERSVHKKQ